MNQTGRTTRLANAIIETLFTTGSALIKDHKDQNELLKIVFNRLETEHSRGRFIYWFTKENSTIMLGAKEEGRWYSSVVYIK